MTYQELAEEVIQKWSAEPKRVERALKIVNTRGMVMMAQKDEHDHAIEPSEALIIVRASSQRGWYFVRRMDHSCTCMDHRKGNLCKHRIAAYLYIELPKRMRQEVAPRFDEAAAIAALGY